MKKLLLSVLVFSTLAANAQYVVTSFHSPVIGDVEYMAIDTLPSVTPGSAGASQTWDLSGMVSSVETITNYIDPSTTTFGSDFPDADVAADFDGFIGYIETSSTFARLIGVALDAEIFGSPVQGSAEVTPADTLLVFNSEFNDAYTDNSSYTIIASADFEFSGFQVDSIRNTENKTEVITFDGYGTVTTPIGIFANVLREKVVTTTTTNQEGYVVFLGGWNSPGGPTTEETVVYNWYADKVKFPVASVTTDVSGTNATEASYNNDSELLSIASSEQASWIKFYPNPVVEQAVIANSAKGQVANIFDLNGRLVQVKNLSEGMTTINLSDLSEGTYQLQILENGKQVTAETFIKQ
jgi:hypothetical protein